MTGTSAGSGGVRRSGADRTGVAAATDEAGMASEAHRIAGEQGLLFGPEEGMPEPPTDDVGYRGQTACAATGITYRQLDYWARTELVVPSVRAAMGSGSHRLYSFRDILLLKVIKRLLDLGISLQQVRTAIDHLRDRGVRDLTGVTLISDGASVYECTSPDEVIDLLQGGQGVFGIAVGRVSLEVEGKLAEFPSERFEPAAGSEESEADQEARIHGEDELARRRQARLTG